MWFLYQLCFLLLTLVSAPFLLVKRGSHYLSTLGGRLGLDRGAQPPSWSPEQRPLWLHAVSVGEVGVADALSQGLSRDTQLLVSTVTPTGQERARATFADRAWVRYLPFDLGWPVARFLSDCNPRALILIEGEFWPLLLNRVAGREIPAVVVNGRISDRTYRRQRRLKGLFGESILRPLYSPLLGLGVQSEDDRRRLLDLGLDEAKVLVTGNLKYESAEPRRTPELESFFMRLASQGEGRRRAIVVAGSTMPGEEEQILEALARLGSGRVLLLLAPRHPERFDEVARRIESAGLPFLRRSGLDPKSLTGDRPTPSADVVLLDTLGELAGLYAIGDVAFVGGTLVPTGGHNPLEPARYGTPVVVGPSMENFREMAQHFDRASAWKRVSNADQLAVCFNQLLSDEQEARVVGQRGKQLIEDNRGALARTRQMLVDLGIVRLSAAGPEREP